MGYLPMNLTTLQLPAPSSSMTKAEYKEAYGIDLDAIDFKAFRLVVFGNQKYAIEQIKEVEDGIEIYFNGRIMSITDTVQISDEVYDVANSKPIYYHGIELQQRDSLGIVYAHILNNSETPFNTFDKIVSWFTSQPRENAVYLQCSGFITREGTAQDIYVFYRRANETVINIVIKGSNGYEIIPNVTLSTLFSSITDGVNKIN